MNLGDAVAGRRRPVLSCRPIRTFAGILMEIRATPRRRTATIALALFGVASVVVPLLGPAPASAQGVFGWGDQPPTRRRVVPQPQFNPFGLFAPSPPSYQREPAPNRPRRDGGERAPISDSTRAPAPRKPDGTPATHVVVLGDSMADWLAYGMEDAYSDDSDIGVLRKIRANAGLVRNDS